MPSTTFENPSYSEVSLDTRSKSFFKMDTDTEQKAEVYFFISFNFCIIPQMKDEKPVGSSADPSEPEPSPFAPPAKLQKRDRPSTFSPTEDSFKDTANLVKEDSDV